eukprot:14473031-Alexandrium_andersonii.AAC.1
MLAAIAAMVVLWLARARPARATGDGPAELRQKSVLVQRKAQVTPVLRQPRLATQLDALVAQAGGLPAD